MVLQFWKAMFPMLMPLLYLAYLMPEEPLSARPIASICACLAVAIQMLPDQYETRGNLHTPRAVHHPVAVRWLVREKYPWQSVATRAVQFEFLLHGQDAME